MSIKIRPALQTESDAIRALVHSERLNPNDLDWRRFLVASDGARIVGVVQMRRHADGARELGSLVVHRDLRRLGVASRLIDAMLDAEHGRVSMVTSKALAARYARWGFRPIDPHAAPNSVRCNYRIGQLVGGFVSLLKGRLPRRLVILDRAARD
jgi:N-acetylglutamate synthase-like GNAT family acetyltransferase